MVDVFFTSGEPSLPSVSGPADQVMFNTNVTLSCISVGFYPANILVTWWEDDREFHVTKPDVRLYEDKTYQVQSNITVPAKIDSLITCRINHTALQQPINSSFKINVKGEPSLPSVSGPTEQVMFNTNVTLSCISVGFYPADILVTWWEDDRELHVTQPDVRLYEDKTYQVQSNITVPAKIDSLITCRINHTALQQPINSSFKINVKGEPSLPSVSGPTEQVMFNTNVTLSCISAGFYPADILVTWWEDDRELHVTQPDVRLYEDKTYQVQSNITVSAKPDSLITCRISHISLQQPIHSTFKINVTADIFVSKEKIGLFQTTFNHDQGNNTNGVIEMCL
ncbi:tyrosine-protein phosphatase non-receptor type substrate 1-like [Protopterus annectens]|uniref:tyrosine-protein phosphatase non-receptor type substrate 1-like n=1 Tax=Protopterus annectens TaxID=7888 RepID=UPI001CFAF497|nr:tyrosine-protein phosphatase non-receptor type substrate 1-like [Protopterus annectens]